MIITCPNCKKKFQIDPALVPEKGRDLQCGSCNHAWFYKPENESEAILALNENTFINKAIIAAKNNTSPLAASNLKNHLNGLDM